MCSAVKRGGGKREERGRVKFSCVSITLYTVTFVYSTNIHGAPSTNWAPFQALWDMPGETVTPRRNCSYTLLPLHRWTELIQN